eukprot:TRINITY_DN11427_c0_g2_i5.p1 TRINITY_DN11427_c0_g2~~TRINITY_DN11427_c0_g2_i5.p1  ORF type:complete len:1143 (+),score=298.13 TRINITY_DN11427_c0_g2_i5:40-3468(+)
MDQESRTESSPSTRGSTVSNASGAAGRSSSMSMRDSPARVKPRRLSSIDRHARLLMESSLSILNEDADGSHTTRSPSHSPKPLSRNKSAGRPRSQSGTVDKPRRRSSQMRQTRSMDAASLRPSATSAPPIETSSDMYSLPVDGNESRRLLMSDIPSIEEQSEPSSVDLSARIARLSMDQVSLPRTNSDEQASVPEVIVHDDTPSPPPDESVASSHPSSTGELRALVPTLEAGVFTPRARRRHSAQVTLTDREKLVLQQMASVSDSPSSSRSASRRPSDQWVQPVDEVMSDGFMELVDEAQRARRSGDYERAVSLYKSALNIGTHVDAHYKAVLVNLGLAYEALGRYALAQEQYHLARLRVQESEDKMGEAEVLCHQGMVAELQGQLYQAKESYITAYELIKTLPNNEHQLSLCASHLACAYSASGDYEEAYSWHKTALLVLKAGIDMPPGPDDADDLTVCLSHVGVMAVQLNRPAEALQCFKEELDLYSEAAKQEDIEGMLDACERVVHLHIVLGSHDEAIAVLQKAVIHIRHELLACQRSLRDSRQNADVNPEDFPDLLLSRPSSRGNLPSQDSSRSMSERDASPLRTLRSPLKRAVSNDAPVDARRAPLLGDLPRAQSQPTQPDPAEERGTTPPPAGEETAEASSNSDPDASQSSNQATDIVKELLMEAKYLHYRLATALGNLGAMYIYIRKPDLSYEAYCERRKLLQKVNDLSIQMLSEQADTNMRLGLICLTQLRYKAAISFFKQEVDIRTMMQDEENKGVALCNLGHALVRSGDVRRGVQIHTKASLLAKDVVKDPAMESRAYLELGAAFASAGAYEMALEAYSTVLQMNSTVNDQAMAGKCHLDLSGVYLALDDTDQAFHHVSQVIATARDNDWHLLEAQSYIQLGRACERVARYEEALECYRIARSLGDGVNSILVPSSLALGNLLLVFGRAHAAASCFDIVLYALQELKGHQDFLSQAEALSGLGEACMQQRDFKRAIKHYKAYLNTLAKLRHDESAAHATGLTNLATAYAENGQLKMSMGALQQALKVADEADSHDVWQRGYRLSMLGFLHLQCNELDQAQTCLEGAQIDFDTAITADVEVLPDAATNLTRMAAVYQRLGQTDEATACQQRIAALMEEDTMHVTLDKIKAQPR